MSVMAHLCNNLQTLGSLKCFTHDKRMWNLIVIFSFFSDFSTFVTSKEKSIKQLIAAGQWLDPHLLLPYYPIVKTSLSVAGWVCMNGSLTCIHVTWRMSVISLHHYFLSELKNMYITCYVLNSIFHSSNFYRRLKQLQLYSVTNFFIFSCTAEKINLCFVTPLSLYSPV